MPWFDYRECLTVNGYQYIVEYHDISQSGLDSLVGYAYSQLGRVDMDFDFMVEYRERSSSRSLYIGVKSQEAVFLMKLADCSE